MKPECASCRYSCYSFAVKSFVCYLHSQEPKIVDEHDKCDAFSDVVDEVIIDKEKRRKQMSKYINGKGKIKYVINEENRTVVAILEDSKREAHTYMSAPADRFFKGQLSVPGYFSHDFTIIDQAIKDCIEPKYIGIAKCAPEDEFDEQVGMSIARARCLTKYYRDLWAAFAKTKSLYRQLADALNDRQIETYKNYTHWFEESWQERQ